MASAMTEMTEAWASGMRMREKKAVVHSLPTPPQQFYFASPFSGPLGPFGR